MLSDLLRFPWRRGDRNSYFTREKDEKVDADRQTAAVRRRAVLRGDKVVEVSEAPERETR